MKKLVLLLMLLFGVGVAANAQVSSHQAWNFRVAASLPSTCKVGDVYYKTGADAGSYNCSATNTWTAMGGGGSGTVESVSVTTANGVSGVVASPTTTPAITLTLGDITPSSVVTTGSVTTGSGGSNAGDVELTEGVAPVSLTANTIQLIAPTDVDAGGYRWLWPTSPASGFLLGTNSAGIVSLSHIGSTGTGNVVRAASPTIDSLTVTTSCTGCGAAINSTNNFFPIRSNATTFIDSLLQQPAANTVEQRSGTNTQVFGLYARYVSGSDYRGIFLRGNGLFKEAAGASDDGSELFIGTSTQGNLGFRTNAGTKWVICGPASCTDGTLIPTIAYDIGTSSQPIGNLFYTGTRTATNCLDSAGAAACGSAAAGSVVIDAAATSTVISTTAVTANSQIFVQYDSSLGTRLSVTCNVTPAIPAVTARTAGTSFTITVPVGPVTNPACYSYHIVN